MRTARFLCSVKGLHQMVTLCLKCYGTLRSDIDCTANMKQSSSPCDGCRAMAKKRADMRAHHVDRKLERQAS